MSQFQILIRKALILIDRACPRTLSNNSIFAYLHLYRSFLAFVSLLHNVYLSENIATFNKNTLNKNTLNKNTLNKNTLNKNTLNKNTLAKNTYNRKNLLMNYDHLQILRVSLKCLRYIKKVKIRARLNHFDYCFDCFLRPQNQIGSRIE